MPTKKNSGNNPVAIAVLAINDYFGNLINLNDFNIREVDNRLEINAKKSRMGYVLCGINGTDRGFEASINQVQNFYRLSKKGIGAKHIDYDNQIGALKWGRS